MIFIWLCVYFRATWTFKMKPFSLWGELCRLLWTLLRTCQLGQAGCWPPRGPGASLRGGWGLFQLHCGKKVTPASDTNDLDTKSIENICSFV